MARVNYPHPAANLVLEESKEPGFVILSQVGARRRGRKRLMEREKAEVKRLQGLQCNGRFAVVRCPLCHEFKIVGRGQKQARCGVCMGRFWLFNARVSATGDNRIFVVAEMQRLRAGWLAALVR